MGKIFCLMGKSASGKDTVYKQLLEKEDLPLRAVVPYTTRPIRDGETNGVEYYFLTDREQQELEKQGKIIELRAYDTVHGVWKYFTADDHQIDLGKNSYLLIGTLASYRKLQAHFGKDAVVPLYLEIDPGERLQRALSRERAQADPKYAELCRRFLADEEDFSPEKLADAQIRKIFVNDSAARCVSEISAYLKGFFHDGPA